MNNEHLNIIISILIGVTFGIVLYKGYFNSSVTRGPNSKDIVDRIFTVNGKYYKLVPQVCGCVNKK